MLPTHVALVPYEKTPVATDELLHVAAALQTQLTRDLNPLWGVVGIVSPFQSILDVPPGYLPLAIVPEGTLGEREQAFHFAPGGQPLALLNYKSDAEWSLSASHELIEMICDPWGNRTVRGSSLKRDQNQVEYLVEVCDPCQHSVYLINGVVVSDFVTPAYYSPVTSDSARFSFTGAVKGPRHLVPGGYISWRAGGREQEIWQARADDHGNISVAQLTAGAPQLTREWVDSHTVAQRKTRNRLQRPEPPGGLTEAHDRALESAKLYGERLQEDVASVLTSLGAAAPPSVDDVLELLEKLAHDEAYWQKFTNRKNTRTELASHRIDAKGITLPKEFPTQQEYARILDVVKRGRLLGPGFDQPALAKSLVTLGMFGMTS